ncbi:hypothetical protein DUNSADRAFT_15173 [Dunaliella salina]|uniref:Helicase ATP-binding domain-containing protein n=1 Tax=Dunaliella salina TaxID=3046 RepID=A0ABQ7G5X3_DUNSA|nr:hypothetical protein DUNSADRAFT_15173 [Dunaliella salina]|eukprot:KAF5830016.1 hypothetical protein DUNSADRAFT_15173 [Dunaliella salina]
MMLPSMKGRLLSCACGHPPDAQKCVLTSPVGPAHRGLPSLLFPFLSFPSKWSQVPRQVRKCSPYRPLRQHRNAQPGSEAGVLHAQGPAAGQAPRPSGKDGEIRRQEIRRQSLSLQAIAVGTSGLDTIVAHELLNSIWLGEFDEIQLEGIASQTQKEELQDLVKARGFRMLQHDAGQGEDFTVSRWTIMPEGPMTYAAGPRSGGLSINGICLAKSMVLDPVSFGELLQSVNLQPGCGEAIFRIYPNVLESAARFQAAAQKRGMHLVFYHLVHLAVLSHASEPQPSYRADMDPEIMHMKLPWRLLQAVSQAATLDHQVSGTAFTADGSAATASEDRIIQEYVNPSKWFAGGHSGGSSNDHDTSTIHTSHGAQETLHDEEEDVVSEDQWWAAGDEPVSAHTDAKQAAAAAAEARNAEREGLSSVRDMGLYRGRVAPRVRKLRISGASQRSRERLSASLRAQQRSIARSQKGRRLREQRSCLPVFEEKARLLRAISDNQVIVVSGETGSGKSTQVPQFILEEAIWAREGAGTSVMVTQPRRVSAISLAQRVAYERSERLGDVVGYKVRLEAQASSRTRLLFCTSGVALRRLLVDPELQSVSHVVLDEVHERAVNTDFLLVALRDLLPRRPDLKVILMSATINADSFTDYFGGCPHFAFKGRRFEVGKP